MRENGFDPIWDEVLIGFVIDLHQQLLTTCLYNTKVFTFNVNKTDLAQLTFQVLNDDSILGMNRQAVIASASIPLACLRPGFRIVRLYDENGRNDFDFAFATLFVHITKIILG